MRKWTHVVNSLHAFFFFHDIICFKKLSSERRVFLHALSDNRQLFCSPASVEKQNSQQQKPCKFVVRRKNYSTDRQHNDHRQVLAPGLAFNLEDPRQVTQLCRAEFHNRLLYRPQRIKFLPGGYGNSYGNWEKYRWFSLCYNVVQAGHCSAYALKIKIICLPSKTIPLTH